MTNNKKLKKISINSRIHKLQLIMSDDIKVNRKGKEKNQKKDKNKFMYGQKRVRQLDHIQELQKKRNEIEKKKICT